MAGPGLRWVLVREQEGAASPPPTPGGGGGVPSSGAASSGGGASDGAAPVEEEPDAFIASLLQLPSASGRRASGQFADFEGGAPLSPSGEGLASRLRRRDAQVESLRRQVAGLERTRDSLMTQLLASARADAAAAEAAAASAAARAELEALGARHAAAVELLGEREEALEEAREDLAELRSLYKEQVATLAERLDEALLAATPRGGGDGPPTLSLPPRSAAG
jgi:prefoldin subunit 5